MASLTGIILPVACITLAVVLGLLAELAEEKIRSWSRTRKIQKWERDKQ